MLDRYGRRIHYLRVSVTDRCNLRCVYCMPQQGVEWVAHSAVLSYEQLLRLVGLLARLGVDKVRLTGGEPLVRRDLAQLVRGIRSVEGIQSVSLTTNGVLLKQQLPGLMEAGLSGVNLSLDTLDRAQYAAITRRDALDDALQGLEAALAAPGLSVKLNCVPMGENDAQLVPLAALARDRPGEHALPQKRGGGAAAPGGRVWARRPGRARRRGRTGPVCDLCGLCRPRGFHQRDDASVLRRLQPGPSHRHGVFENLPSVRTGGGPEGPDGGGGGRPDAAGGDGAGHSGKARLPPFFRGTQPRGRG